MSVYLKNRKNIIIFFSSLLSFIIAFILQSFIGRYVEQFNYPPAGDFFHNILPLINLNWLITYVHLILSIIFIGYFFFYKKKNFSQVMITLSLLIIIRSLFVAMTHMGDPAIRINDYSFFDSSLFYFTKDLFFSGHVMWLFLAYLFTRKEKIGNLFLLGTITVAIGALIMRTHYSIDVFAAPFIVYCVYEFSKKYLWKYFTLT